LKLNLARLDDWRASQESIEVKISRQTMVQSIGEQANQLMEDLKKNSEAGKNLIEATQDYQMLDMKLQGALPEIRKASLKHTSQNIESLEKKHEKWLKNNNKYEEMRQTLRATLVGKMAQNGEITETVINDILSGLGWTFDLQE